MKKITFVELKLRGNIVYKPLGTVGEQFVKLTRNQDYLGEDHLIVVKKILEELKYELEILN